jgi:hypothetical protein
MTFKFLTPTLNRGNTFQISTSLNRIALLIRYNIHQPTQHTTKGILELMNRILQCFNLMLNYSLPPRPMKYASHTRFHLVWPSPSYGWKATLFGHVVSKIPEAWQSVSTISRSKLRLHKHSPNSTKTIWARREHLQHLLIQKWRDLNRWIFLNSLNTKEIKGVTWFQTNLSLDVQSVQRMFQEWKGVTWNKSFKPLCIHSYTNSIATVCGLTTEIFYYKRKWKVLQFGKSNHFIWLLII